MMNKRTNAARVRSMTEPELANLLTWVYCNGFNNACNHIYDDPDYLDWIRLLYEEII